MFYLGAKKSFNYVYKSLYHTVSNPKVFISVFVPYGDTTRSATFELSIKPSIDTFPTLVRGVYKLVSDLFPNTDVNHIDSVRNTDEVLFPEFPDGFNY